MLLDSTGKKRVCSIVHIAHTGHAHISVFSPRNAGWKQDYTLSPQQEWFMKTGPRGLINVVDLQVTEVPLQVYTPQGTCYVIISIHISTQLIACAAH